MKTIERIEDLEYELTNGEARNFADHPDLRALEVIFEDDDGCTVVDFCVPTKWLIREEGFDSEESLTLWLQEEYSSEDSERIMYQACRENQIHCWNIR